MTEFDAVPMIPSDVPVLAPRKDEAGVTPIYVWKTGTTIFLSQKEKIVADTFLKTHNYAKCSRALAQAGWDKDWITCKRWLEKPHMQQYIQEKFEESGVASGWTLERWLLVMTKHLSGKERLQNGDLYAMKLIASVRKFEMPDSLNITQINFTEAA